MDAPVAFYHCVSRIVDRNFVLGDLEKEHFVKLMRAYETFCGVRVITVCVMTNHFHILLEVPQRPAREHPPSDQKLVQLLKEAAPGTGATLGTDTFLRSVMQQTYGSCSATLSLSLSNRLRISGAPFN